MNSNDGKGRCTTPVEERGSLRCSFKAEKGAGWTFESALLGVPSTASQRYELKKYL